MTFEEWSKAQQKKKQSFSEWSDQRESAHVTNEYIQAFLSDSGSFFDDMQREYGSIGYGTAGSIYERANGRISDLDARHSMIAKWLNGNKWQLDADTYNSLSSALENYKTHSSSLRDGLKGTADFYAQFENEEAYKSYEQAVARREDMKKADLDALQQEIDELQGELHKADDMRKSMEQLKWKLRGTGDANAAANISSQYKTLEEQYEASGGDDWISSLSSALSEKKLYHHEASVLQELERLQNDAQRDVDFSAYATKGASENHSQLKGSDIGPFRIVTEGGKSTLFTESTPDKHANYAFLNENEVDVYNYYLGRGDKESADAYLAALDATLNAREAYQLAEDVEGKYLRQIFVGAAAGFDQFASGVVGLVDAFIGNEEIRSPSMLQQASGLVREDLADAGFKIGNTSIGQIGFDLVNTTANMLPSILAGKVAGGVAGTALLGASAGGNAYREMLDLGYNAEQAKGYAALVGASEAGLQYLLGGVTGLGGKLPEGLSGWLASKVDRALAKAAIKLGGNMLGEASEEMLQTVLEPWFQSIATEMDYTDPDFEEVLYSSLLGALTSASFAALGGAKKAVGKGVNAIQTWQQGAQTLKQNGGVDALMQLANEVTQNRMNAGAQSAAAGGTTVTQTRAEVANQTAPREMSKQETRLADRVSRQAQKVDKKKRAYAVGKLANITRELAARQAQMDDIYELQKKHGYAEKVAKQIVDARAKALRGEVLTKHEEQLLASKDVQAFYENDNRLSYRRMRYYEEIGAIQQEEDVQATTGDTGNTRPSDGTVVTVDADGVASSARVAEIGNGGATLVLEDGTQVSADSIELQNEDDALLLDHAVKRGMNAKTANVMLAGYSPEEGISLAAYTAAFDEVYDYGRKHIPVEELKGNEKIAGRLSSEQIKKVYDLGKKAENAAARQTQKNLDERKASADPSAKKKGEVHYEGAKIKKQRMTDRQRASVKALEVVADALGTDIYIFESENREGSANGWYDPSDGSIHIDLHAGANGEATMLFTAAHELTHMIREWSLTKYKVLADFLMKEYGKKGVSVSELVQAQIEKAKANGRELSFDEAYEEVVADSCEAMLVDSNAIEKIAALKEQDASLWEKIKTYIARLVAKIKEVYANLNPDSVEAGYVREMVDVAEKLQGLWTEALVDAASAQRTASVVELTAGKKMAERNAMSESKVHSYSENYYDERDRLPKISMGMTDAERTNILRKKSVIAPVYSGQADVSIIREEANLNHYKIGVIKATLERMAKEFGIIGEEINIEDVDVRVTLSKTNIGESLSKEADPIQMAKLLPILKPSVESSIGIESHSNRYYFDTDTVYFDNLLGGYVDGDDFVPVRFGLKHSASGKATLYVVVDQNKIPVQKIAKNKKTEVLKTTGLHKATPTASRSVIYSISQIVPFVKSKDLLRYLPDDMLNAEQKRIKWEGIAETIKTTDEKNDKKYKEFIESGNLRAAQEMVIAAAREKGYNTPRLYHGSQESFTTFSYGKIGTATGVDILGEGFYFTDTKQLGAQYGDKLYEVYLKLHNPYAAVADDAYKLNATELLRKGYDGVTLETPKGKIYMVFDNTQIKSADPIVYDDNGNVIPLSERFKAENRDIRYQERSTNVKRESYSYESLVRKPDMKVTTVGENVPNNRADVVFAAKQNAAKVGKFNLKDGSVSVHVNDVDADVIVTKRSLVHGLDRRLSTQAPVIVKIGEVLENSIKINELTPRAEDVRNTYVLVGTAQSQDGGLYVVSFVVNKYSNEVAEIDVLYSANAKKELAALLPKFTDKSATPTNSNISIAQLLDYVNRYFPDILPESVLKHYGHTARPDGKIGESALYSERDPVSMSNRSILASALESAAQNDDERKLLRDYKENAGKYDEMQQHLSEVNAQIKELSFAKGPRDKAKLIELNAEKNKTINRIDIYDKRLLRLEAAASLKDLLARERKKVLTKQKAKAKAELAAQHKADLVKYNAMVKHNREMREKNTEGRRRTQMKHAIQKNLKELAHLFLHGNKERNVKIALKDAARAALNTFAVSLEKDGENAKLEFSTLQTVYSALKEDKNAYAKHAYEQTVADLLAETNNELYGLTISQMTSEQLKMANRVLRAMQHTIAKSNQLFKAEKGANLQASAESTRSELMKGRDIQEYKRVSWLGHVKDFMLFGNMLPIQYFEMLGSQTMKQLFYKLRKAEGVYARDIDEARVFAEKTKEKYGFKDWDIDKSYDFVSSTGRRFKLKLLDMMSLYGYSKREQAGKHLEEGGIVFDDKHTFKKEKGLWTYQNNSVDPYKINEGVMQTVLSKLTKEQLAYVDEMQRYLSENMGAKGNEVSRELYGIDLFTESNYLQLKSSEDYLASKNVEIGKLLTSSSLKDMGSAKPTVPNANNPIVLQSFEDLFFGSVNQMALYHSTVLPLENIRRVFEYNFRDGNGSSMKSVITGVMGGRAAQYMDTFLKDVNGTRIGEENGFMNRALSATKRAKVAYNLSVVSQQYTSVIRAMAMIEPRYFNGLDRRDMHGIVTDYAEMREHAPIAIVKEIGKYDAGMGYTATDYMKGTKRASEIFMKPAEKMDMLGWTTIWRAVKREVRACGKYSPGTQEFFDACEERFNDVIVHTQVYDSVFSKSEWMRSKSFVHKMATSFMGEPTVNVNMAVSALSDFKKGNYKVGIRKLSAVAVNIALANAIKSVISAIRDDEDEDESFAEKWAGNFGESMFADLTGGMLPYVRDFQSIFAGFSVERPDAGMINDLWQAGKKIVTAGQSAFSGEIEDAKGWFDWASDDMLPAVGTILNYTAKIPLDNIMRDFRALVNAWRMATDDISGGDVGGELVRGVLPDKSLFGLFSSPSFAQDRTKQERIYDAMLAGDEARLKVLKGSYKTNASYSVALRQGLRDNDARVTQAARLHMAGRYTDYADLCDEIATEGIFKEADIKAAVNSKISELAKQAGNEDSGASADAGEKVVSFYSAKDLNTAFDAGDVDMAKDIMDDLIRVHIANGKTKEKAKAAVRSSITSYWKTLYQEAYELRDRDEIARIQAVLVASGLYKSVRDTLEAWREE